MERSYVYLVSVQEPLMPAFKRLNQESEEPISLENFLEQMDLYKFSTDIHKIQIFTRHSINSNSNDTILESISKSTLLKRISQNKYRISMDKYFMSIAFLAA